MYYPKNPMIDGKRKFFGGDLDGYVAESLIRDWSRMNGESTIIASKGKAKKVKLLYQETLYEPIAYELPKDLESCDSRSTYRPCRRCRNFFDQKTHPLFNVKGILEYEIGREPSTKAYYYEPVGSYCCGVCAVQLVKDYLYHRQEDAKQVSDDCAYAADILHTILSREDPNKKEEREESDN